MKKYAFLILTLVWVFVSSCNYLSPATSNVPPTQTTLPFTATPPNHPAITPEPRWITYERALSQAIITFSEGICEWSILGESNHEVYVWAICRDKASEATVSVPAVIYLDEKREILRAAIPRDGKYYGEDIRNLFPKNMQEKIIDGKDFNFDMKAAENYLEKRLLDTSLPPLIEKSGTPLP